MRIVVISDVHVGAGPLDDLDQDLEDGLVDFLEHLSSEGTPTELVINGDFLDFAQAEPWMAKDFESQASDGTFLCFTESQSREKLKNIIGSHRRVFTALAHALRSDVVSRVTILPGNHDADFFWVGVRKDFRAELGLAHPYADKLHFCLEVVYRPNLFPSLWIEHGHQRALSDKHGLTYEPP